MVDFAEGLINTPIPTLKMIVFIQFVAHIVLLLAMLSIVLHLIYAPIFS